MTIRIYLLRALISSITIGLFTTSTALAANNSRAAYIQTYKEEAIKTMREKGIPASITMAQACLESSDGNSPLATEANNHFGIKCAEWKGPSYTMDDDKKNECFRKYPSVLESYEDHGEFLRNRTRYASLFQLDVKDYKGWAHGLKKAGYATDPNYAHRLIKIIEDHQLYLLDQGQDVPIAIAKPIIPEKKGRKPGVKIFVPTTEVEMYSNRSVNFNNGVPYIVAKEGDNFNRLAKELELGTWQLPIYNEMPSDVQLTAGQKVYIKPKKRSNNLKLYTVKSGDTIESIAHQMGVKKKFILKYNKLTNSDVLQNGQVIALSASK